MKNKNILLISALCLSLGLSFTSLEAATAKKKASPAKSKKQAQKTEKQAEKQAKNKKIIPTESFYDKMWDKYKVGDKNDRADVAKVLKKIIKDSPDEFMAYYYLGIISKDDGQANQALKYFEIALAGFPKSSDIHIRMAKILDEKNKKEEANAHYSSALSLEPNNPIALSKVGIMELENKNYVKASEYLTKAKNIQPDNSETLKALGETWLEQGKYSNSIDILEQVLLFDQTDAKVHLLLGKAYEKINNPEKSSEHIELAGKYGKKDSSIIEAIGYDIARNYSKLGKYEEAIAAYKKEIKTNPEPALGYYEMGETFEKLDDIKNAIKAYKKSYEVDKKMVKGIYRCVQLYKEQNDIENAEKMLKILKSKQEYKDEAIEMIDNLKEEEKEKAERELSEKLNSKGSKDADIEAAYLENFNSNKKDSETIENLYNFYKERGYYDEAIKWYRKYAKVSNITDYQRKTVEAELKEKLEQDNYDLFGGKSEEKPNKSTISSDDLLNKAFNGNNDRQKELALQILLSRKEYKEDKKVVEGMLDFYESRGRVKEASKYINLMKKLGYLSEAEAKARKERMKE